MRIPSIAALFAAISLLAAGEDNLETIARRARQAMEAGHYQEAAGLYERMVKILPNEPGARFNLALALDAAGRPGDALKQLEQIKAAAANPRFWFLLGIEYQKLRQPARAVDPLERAVKLDPGNGDYRLELGDAYLSSGAVSRAAAVFRALSGERPGDARVLAGEARALLAMSSDAYDELVRVAPGSSFQLALEALAEADKGDRTKADALYRRAAAAGPPAPWLAGEQSGSRQAASDVGHPLAAAFHRGDLDEVVRRTASGPSPESLYWRARSCAELARAPLAKLSALPPSPEAHELAGVALRQSRRWEDSIAEFQQALKLAPGDVRLQSELAKSYWLSRRFDEAVKLLQPLVANGWERGDWEFELGDSLYNMGQPEQALPHLRKGASKLPGNFAAQAMLGRVLLEMGRHEEAAPVLERAAARDPDGSIHFQLASAYRGMGRPDLARQAIAKQKEIEARRAGK